MATITSDKLRSFLRKRNFMELGCGLYSDVFAPPTSDRVIKICRNQDPWPNYILWATKMGYAGTFAPKVYSLHIFDGGYAATMERLNKIELGMYRFTDPAIEAQFQAWDRFYYSAEPIPAEIETMRPGCTKFMAELREFRKDMCHAPDLHRGNVMQRHNGDLVMIDPVQGETTHPPKRMRTRDIAWVRNAQFANQKAYAKG